MPVSCGAPVRQIENSYKPYADFQTEVLALETGNGPAFYTVGSVSLSVSQTNGSGAVTAASEMTRGTKIPTKHLLL